MGVLRLTKERKARGWSQSELARRAWLNQVTVGNVERGRQRPYPSQLAKIAVALEWQGDPQELLGEIDDHGNAV